jgi:hypothetical protein
VSALVIRIAVALVGLGFLAGLGFWGYRTVYDAGLTAGRAEIQAKWDADRIAADQKLATIEADNAEKLRQADELNQETVDEYEHKLATVADSVSSYASRLHAVEAKLAAAGAGSPVPQAANQPATPPTPLAIGPGQIESAIGARLAECDVNEAQLSALITEIKPQIAVAPEPATQ